MMIILDRVWPEGGRRSWAYLGKCLEEYEECTLGAGLDVILDIVQYGHFNALFFFDWELNVHMFIQ